MEAFHHTVGTFKGPVSDKEAERTKRNYDRLIEPMREAARECGYALAVHGSLRRDIDLIAVPWAPGACSARKLMGKLLAVCRRVTRYGELSWHMGKDKQYTIDGAPGNKPHGRLTWVINIFSGGYIDLSVMPRANDAETQ